MGGSPAKQCLPHNLSFVLGPFQPCCLRFPLLPWNHKRGLMTALCTWVCIHGMIHKHGFMALSMALSTGRFWWCWVRCATPSFSSNSCCACGVPWIRIWNTSPLWHILDRLQDVLHRGYKAVFFYGDEMGLNLKCEVSIVHWCFACQYLYETMKLVYNSLLSKCV